MVACEVVRLDGVVIGRERTMTGRDGAALFSHSLSAATATGAYVLRVNAVAHSDATEVTYLPDANLKRTVQFEVRK